MQIIRTEAQTFPNPVRKIALICMFLSFVCLNISAQDSGGITLSGTVISSEDDQPIIGAAVYVEGTQYGTTTDLDGNYSLTVPSSTLR